MRGFHECPFCGDNKFIDPDHFMVSASFKGEKRLLGCKEIFLLHENMVFIAPNLIFHYVTQHSYKPPSVFCEALMALQLI